jgi:hypothetical protein
MCHARGLDAAIRGKHRGRVHLARRNQRVDGVSVLCAIERLAPHIRNSAGEFRRQRAVAKRDTRAIAIVRSHLKRSSRAASSFLADGPRRRNTICDD